MKISNSKKEKICEHILEILFLNSPKPLFTFEIAKETARDEEFIKSLLTDLKKKGLIQEIKKNSEGKDYLKRSRWVLSDQTYQIFKKKQESAYF
jgi:predicted transcriptional regulator